MNTIATFVLKSMVVLWLITGLSLGWVLPGTIAVAQDETPPTATPADRHSVNEQTIAGGNFVLRPNETMTGDLVVLGGSVTVETGARVEGDVNVAGGSADIKGTVTGDVNVLGGSIKLRRGSVIEGGTQVLGGSVDREEGATVKQASHNLDLKIDTPAGQIDLGKRIGRDITNEVARANADSTAAPSNGWQSALAIISGIVWVGILVLLILVSISVVTLIPDKTARMLTTVREQWLVSGGIGLLTIVALTILIALFTITLCLIPLAGALGLALIAGVLIGTAVMARDIGERLMTGFGRHDWPTVKKAVVGAIAIAIIGAVPVLNFLVYLGLASVGLGALILTRFGTRPYPYPMQLPSGL